MSGSDEAKRLFPYVLSLRFKIALVSLLSLVVTTACSRLRLRGTEEPDVLCYIVAPPTDTPTPVVLCYEVMLPTETPVPGDPALSHTPTPTLTPTPVCYTATPSSTSVPPKTPTVMCYAPPADAGLPALDTDDSRIPLPIPTPTATPTMGTTEARRLLRERLLAEGRFPEDVARRLGG